MNKEEYGRYLRSEQWRHTRARAIKRAKGKCLVCSDDENLQVHHKTYERIGGDELPDDLAVLCQKCHKWVHEGRITSVPNPLPVRKPGHYKKLKAAKKAKKGKKTKKIKKACNGRRWGAREYICYLCLEKYEINPAKAKAVCAKCGRTLVRVSAKRTKENLAGLARKNAEERNRAERKEPKVRTHYRNPPSVMLNPSAIIVPNNGRELMRQHFAK